MPDQPKPNRPETPDKALLCGRVSEVLILFPAGLVRPCGGAQAGSVPAHRAGNGRALRSDYGPAGRDRSRSRELPDHLGGRGLIEPERHREHAEPVRDAASAAGPRSAPSVEDGRSVMDWFGTVEEPHDRMDLSRRRRNRQNRDVLGQTRLWPNVY